MIEQEKKGMDEIEEEYEQLSEESDTPDDDISEVVRELIEEKSL